MSSKMTKVVEQLVLPILEKEDLELIDIEYKKEGNNWFLRVYIDKPNSGVDIDDCGRVSEALSKELDRVDPVSNPYFLEVSSPGAERSLKKEKNIAWAVGKHVNIKTYEPINEQKVFEGKLIQFENNILTLELEKETLNIPYEKIAKARLAIVF